MTSLEALSCIIYSLFALLYDLLPHLLFLYVPPLLSLFQSPVQGDYDIITKLLIR